MLFSIVIPTYNRADLLPCAIASVQGQQFTDYEIIVVDDGSQDGTREYLQGLEPQIRYLRQENGGPGAARNAGICAARGDYVAFLDSDDLWFPWTLTVFARAISEHGEPTVLGGHCIEFSDKSELATIR